MNEGSSSFSSQDDKNWCIWHQGQVIYLNNLDYLNHLLKESQSAISRHDILRIRTLVWDFQEILESDISPLYHLQVKSEMASLKRIGKLKKFNDSQEVIILPD